MKKIFTLSTCDTSKKILKESGIYEEDFEVQDIKKTPISASELEEIKALAGSYESLFSRRAQKYKSLGLKNINLSEEQIRTLILEEYTFLKRPLIIDGSHCFVGNGKSTIAQLHIHLSAKSTEKNLGDFI